MPSSDVYNTEERSRWIRPPWFMALLFISNLALTLDNENEFSLFSFTAFVRKWLAPKRD